MTVFKKQIIKKGFTKEMLTKKYEKILIAKFSILFSFAQLFYLFYKWSDIIKMKK